MGADHGHAMLLAGYLAAIPILSTVLMIALCAGAAKGRLQRNQWVGIRTPSTMRSDQAWVTGHRAALRLAPLFVLITVLGCGVLFVTARTAPTPNTLLLTGIGVAAVIIVALFYSAFVASRAAKAVTDQHPGPTLR